MPVVPATVMVTVPARRRRVTSRVRVRYWMMAIATVTYVFIKPKSILKFESKNYGELPARPYWTA